LIKDAAARASEQVERGCLVKAAQPKRVERGVRPAASQPLRAQQWLLSASFDGKPMRNSTGTTEGNRRRVAEKQ